MSILVTGAAGFIGCNNVIALNRRGITDVIAVDNLEKGDKFKNLAQCQISDYFDKRDFIERVRAGTAPRPDAIFHQGACSDTMETDGRYMMENNYRYTLQLYRWAQELRIPFIMRHQPPPTALTRNLLKKFNMRGRSTSTATPSISLIKSFAANSVFFVRQS